VDDGGTLIVRLKKADVERLLTDYDEDPIEALTVALRTTLAMPSASWEALLGAAPIETSRRERLVRGDVSALDQLAAELNERRSLDADR